MEKELSFTQIVKILWKRAWIIAVLMVVFIASAMIYTFKVATPIYRAQAELLVNKSDVDYYSKNEIDTSKELIETYGYVLKTPKIMNQVNKQLPYEINLEDIKVRTPGTSQIMQIQVENTNPMRAVEIADVVVRVFEKEIKNIMKMDNVEILTEAQVPIAPVKPILVLNILVAFIVSAILGMMVVLTLHVLNTKIETEEDVENELELPLLGVMMYIEKETEEESVKTTRAKNMKKLNSEKVRGEVVGR